MLDTMADIMQTTVNNTDVAPTFLKLSDKS